MSFPLHLWEGTHGHRSNHIILSSTRGRSTGPRLFVLPNLNTVLSRPHQTNVAVVVFWGWFETDAARTERQNENQRRWQLEVADVERENTLLKQRYEKQRVAGLSSMQTGSLTLRNIIKTPLSLQVLHASSSVRMPVSLKTAWQRCSHKRNGRAKRL